MLIQLFQFDEYKGLPLGSCEELVQPWKTHVDPVKRKLHLGVMKDVQELMVVGRKRRRRTVSTHPFILCMVGNIY